MRQVTINENTVFTSLTYGQLPMRTVLWKILSYVASDPYARYELAVGTDSMTRSQGTTFAVAITVHKVGKGSIFFYKKYLVNRFFDLHRKIQQETEISLNVAGYITRSLGNQILDKEKDVHLSIHMDVGENGATSKLVDEMGGWVSSMGFDYAIKPESYAASTVADRLSK